jgi:hypothetical protein
VPFSSDTRSMTNKLRFTRSPGFAYTPQASVSLLDVDRINSLVNAAITLRIDFPRRHIEEAVTLRIGIKTSWVNGWVLQ